jgi:tetrapyrrole methylase family protein/MazG family protein
VIEALRDVGVRFEPELEGGIQVVRVGSLIRLPFDPGWGLVILPDAEADPTADADGDAMPDAASDGAPALERGPEAGFTPTVLPGRHARPPLPLAVLAALYPADHPVHGLPAGAETTVGALDTSALAAGAWYLPPLLGEANLASPHGLPWLAARLRAPDGCPWDREQTHLTLRKHLLEEAYEVYDALESGPTPQLADELGDLLLQVVLHAEHAAEAGVFDLTDVYRSIMAKIVRRHPHVFGEVEAATVGDVVRNWETIKAGERAARPEPAGEREDSPSADRGSDALKAGGGGPAMPAAFAGVSRSLPALAYAQEIQERAASLGYDWPDVEGVIDKLEEEALELLAADDQPARHEELGDLLLVIVNLGRKLGVDAEAALRGANAKFARRFARVERLADDRPLASMTFDELDELWARAKREDAEEARG